MLSYKRICLIFSQLRSVMLGIITESLRRIKPETWCAGESGKVERMKEPYGEGIAIPTGLESCVFIRESEGEALTAVRPGWELSRGNRFVAQGRLSGRPTPSGWRKAQAIIYMEIFSGRAEDSGSVELSTWVDMAMFL